VIEIEGPNIDADRRAFEPRLGPALREGDVATFRYADEDVSSLARLQADARGSVARCGGVRTSATCFSGSMPRVEATETRVAHAASREPGELNP
jgi:phosphoribosylformylglycinamidine (FGAM) synthase-like amidotransferase family enzyme